MKNIRIELLLWAILIFSFSMTGCTSKEIKETESNQRVEQNVFNEDQTKEYDLN